MEEIPIIFRYLSEECAWGSKKIALDCSIFIEILFKEHGKIIIQKQNEPDGPAPKIYISKETQGADITLRGHPDNKIIQIFTSAKPQRAVYTKLVNKS